MDKTLDTSHKNNDVSLLDSVISIRDELNSQSKDYEIPEYIPGEISDAFAMLDPDLAMLHKDMKTAFKQLNNAKADGQMSDIIKWRYDSAKGAYQARLIEVRRNKLLQEAASQTMDGEEAQAKRELHALSMQEKMNEQFAALREKRLREKRRKESGGGNFILYFLLALWFAQIRSQQRARNLDIQNRNNPHKPAITGNA